MKILKDVLMSYVAQLVEHGPRKARIVCLIPTGEHCDALTLSRSG